VTAVRSRRARILAVTVLVALAAAAALALRGLAGGSSSSGVASIAATRQVLPAGERPAVSAISGTTLDGRPLSTAQWHGDIVVVNFWGSWCAPCRHEAPLLRRISTDSYRAGVRFLGVDVRDNTASGQAFARQHHILYPSLDDPSDMTALRMPRGLAPQATPSTYVLDRHGRVAAVFFGEVHYDELHSAVELVVERG
jgi:thiol-disulfide isomerase/thioredoxin